MDYTKFLTEDRIDLLIGGSWEAVLYNPLRMVRVSMNDGKYSKEALTTGSLNGCLALISRTKNGKLLHGIMTHYDPRSTDLHTHKIDQLLTQYSEDLINGDTKAALFYPKMGASIDKLAQRVVEGFERVSQREGIVKMIPYPIETELVLFTGTEGILNFDVVTGQYDFQPHTAREGYNPNFHDFL
ncbi:MAG: hypothetical protein WCV90_00485 [Candidatus Woesearchaeota archaeon]|jgi:hypothetical protein